MTERTPERGAQERGAGKFGAGELATRLAAGESPAALAYSFLAGPVRDTLTRCSAVPVFDARLYQKVLRGDGPTLPELAADRLVRRVPGRGDPGGDAYRMEAALRAEAWKRWWTREGLTPKAGDRPAALVELTAALATEYGRVGQPLEELRQLVVADPDRAHQLFVRLFDEADDRFDLAGCQNLLDVLFSEDRAQLVPLDLAEERAEKVVQLSARNLWAPEYLQSARYFARPELEAPLRALLGGSPVVQLCAQGGMGKTMQLRWFIARHLRMLSPPVPCALVDFDRTNPANAVPLPWLLLLDIAEQFDRQLLGAPFTAVRREHGRYLAALRTSERDDPDADLVDRATALDQDAADVRLRVTAVLAERTADQPVVVVLDTLEHVLARPAVKPDALLAMFRELQDAVPALRLVLSGRNDLRDPRTGQIAQFPDAVTVPVELLSLDDRRRYLTEVRGLTAAALVEAITRKSGGVPFTLALFGDLARGPNPPTAADVEQASGPALLYCLERVLERIPDDQVRWLLRYGAVPRTLSLDFVLNVMWRPLVAGISGTSTVDRPDLDERPRPPDRPVRIWVADEQPPVDEPAVRALWDQLTAYASGSSWISFSDSEPESLVIHPIVRRPLRELLGAQEVYRELHAAALAYYRRRAKDDPARRVRWLSHALYHQCYLDPDAAVDDWRAAVAAARESGRPDAVQALVGDLFADATADAPLAGDPYLAGSEPDLVIPPRIRYEASVEIASATADTARSQGATGSHHLWSTVESELAEADRVLAAHPELGERSTQHRLARAKLLLARGDRAGALGELSPILAAPDQGVYARDAAFLLAEALAVGSAESPAARRYFRRRSTQRSVERRVEWHGGDEWSAEVAYAEAYTRSEELGDSGGAAQVVLTAADGYLRREDYAEAQKWLDRVPGGDQARLETAVRRAELLQRTNRPAEALATLLPEARTGVLAGPLDAGTLDLLLGKRLQKAKPAALAHRALLVAGHALVGLRRPAAAADLLRHGPGGTPAETCARHLLQARAHAAMVRIDEALGLVERAVRLAGNEPELAALAKATGAEIHLRTVGNLLEAGQHLDEGDRHRPQPGGEAWLALRLGRAELLDAAGQTGAAHAALAEATHGLPADAPPAQCVRLAVHGLCLRPGPETEGYAAVVAGYLPRVGGSPAQLAALGGLDRCAHLAAALPPLRALLSELLDRAAQEHPSNAADRAVRDLMLAEIARLLRTPDHASRLLDQAAATLGGYDPGSWDPGSWWIWWEVLRARIRIGHATPGSPTPPELPFAQIPSEPMLGAAYLTDLADWRFEADPLEETLRRVETANDLLSVAHARPTRYQARLARRLGKIAERRGDPDTVRRQAAVTVAAYAELGDGVNERRYLHRTGIAAELAGSLLPADRPAARPHPAEVRVRLRPEGPAATAVSVTAPDGAGSAPWTALPDPTAGDLVSDLARSPEAWAAATGDALLRPLGEVLGRAPDDAPLDVRLELAGASLAAVPWELARVGGAPLARHDAVRLVYRGPDEADARRAGTKQLQHALCRLDLDPGPVDGLLGPLTGAALRTFTGERGLPGEPEPTDRTWRAIRGALAERRPRRPVRVLLLAQSLDSELDWGHSDSLHEAGAEPTYLSAGLDVETLHDPSWDMLADYAAHARSSGRCPDVVQVTAALEQSGRVPVLDFGGDRDPLTTTMLDDLVRQLTDDVPPTVVLDITAPRSRHELLRQLLLRNDYLHALGGLGTHAAILGFGLHRGTPAQQRYRLLAGMLAGGSTAADICRGLHRLPALDYAGRADWAAADAVALWTAVPPDALLPPGLW